MRSGPLQLPPRPAHLRDRDVAAWSEPVIIDTYPVPAPDRNPLFLENRVYQGSSGRVYPNPVTDGVADEPVPSVWEAIHLENEYLRVMVLPQIGGRIHVVQDRKTGYDLFYRQNVIKPALVGLLGPWISGGRRVQLAAASPSLDVHAHRLGDRVARLTAELSPGARSTSPLSA